MELAYKVHLADECMKCLSNTKCKTSVIIISPKENTTDTLSISLKNCL